MSRDGLVGKLVERVLEPRWLIVAVLGSWRDRVSEGVVVDRVTSHIAIECLVLLG